MAASSSAILSIYNIYVFDRMILLLLSASFSGWFYFVSLRSRILQSHARPPSLASPAHPRKHGHNLRSKEVMRLKLKNSDSNLGSDDNKGLTDKTLSSSSSSSDNLGNDFADELAKVKKPLIWYVGTFFFVAGSLLNFVSFSFAAQSLLAALGSAQFISNVIFGKVSAARLFVFCVNEGMK